MPRPAALLFVVAVLMTLNAVSRADTAGGSGPALMVGTPPPPEQRVHRGNWLDHPYNTWGLRHLERLVPVASVDRGPGPESFLGPLWLDLAPFRFAAPDGRVQTFDEVQDDLRIDALLLWHQGSLRVERYRNGHDARTRHALLTATSAITGLLAEQLIHEKRFDDMRLVTFYLPELQGSAWSGASVRETLDMEVAIDFREIYGDPWSDFSQLLQAGGMLSPPEGMRTRGALHEYLPTLRATGEHGMDFRLASANVEVLGWIMQRTTGRTVAELFGERIFGQLGAERDALFATDPAGMTVASTGLAMTARDLLRLGVMLAQRGQFNARQVLAPEVVQKIEAGGARRHGLPGNEQAPFNSYKANWHVHHPTASYAAWGIHGQYLFVAPAEQAVLVIQSSHPEAQGTHVVTSEAFFHALVGYLQQGH